MLSKVNFILLIDDEEATRFLHKIMAEESGVSDHIIEADGAEAGLMELKNRLSADPISKGIVFLDINMPVVDGWMFLDELRSRNELDLTNVSIYMVSASDFPKDIERIQNEPFVKGYVPKPLTAEKIREVAQVA